MPKIKDVITKNPPIVVDKDLLEVINRNPDFIWSTSLEDLKELARWIMTPRRFISGIPEIVEPYPADQTPTLNSRFKVRTYPDYAGMEIPGPTRYLDTPTLRTVRDTLSDLHKKGLVWKFELHERDYFASNKKQSKILKRISEKDSFDYRWDSLEHVNNRET